MATMPSMLVVAAAVFSSLLLITGAAKLRHPDETARALRGLNRPVALSATLLLAVSEAVVGAWALIARTGIPLALQAILYTGFTFWVVAALRSGLPLRSCGCVGKDDTPPYWGHIVLNSLAAAVSLGAAVSSPLPGTSLIGVVAQILVVALGSWLAWVIIDQGARTSSLVGN